MIYIHCALLSMYIDSSVKSKKLLKRCSHSEEVYNGSMKTMIYPQYYTVEPPNNGHIGSRSFVRCREVSLSGRLTHNLDLPLRTLYRLLRILVAIATWPELLNFGSIKRRYYAVVSSVHTPSLVREGVAFSLSALRGFFVQPQSFWA